MKIFVDLDLTQGALELLQEGTAGHELIFPEVPAASVLAKSEPDSRFGTADIAFGQPDTQAIEVAAQLKWVHVSSSGIARYDNARFRGLMAERKIMVSNSAGVYNEACASHALSFMLAQARNLPHALATRAASGTPTWNQLRNTSGTLRGETVLILGYGAIGKRLAALLKPFGVNIEVFRRTPRGDEGVPVVTEEHLPAAFHRADHVMNILPESEQTRRFFDGTRLGAIKPGAVFYNIGRGATVDQNALFQRLRSGHLKAAWLDVTDPEPLPDDHPLWTAPNCFITPHVAGGHKDEVKSLVRHFLENFSCFLGGEPLVDRVM